MPINVPRAIIKGVNLEMIEGLGKQLLFFDGGMGTLLQARGLQAGEIPETWNILHPEKIKQIHREYLLAGCDIVKANTFGANCFKCKGTDYDVDTLVSAGIKLVKEAISDVKADASQEKRKIYTALDIGSLGKLLKPLGEIEFSAAYDAYGLILYCLRPSAIHMR